MAIFKQETLSDQLAERLLEEVKVLPAGHRLASVRKLASRFSVSTVTVSKVMMCLIQQGWLVSRQGSGVYVANRENARHAGILVNYYMGRPGAGYFYSRVCSTLKAQMEDIGYRTKVYIGFVDESRKVKNKLICMDFLDDVRQDRLQGLAVIDVLPHKEWMGCLRQRRTPVVGPFPFYKHGVMYDKLGMLRLGLERLVEAGRRKIAIMAWEDLEKPLLFKTAAGILKGLGVELQECWFRNDLKPTEPGVGWESFREIWLSAEEKPDGLLITDDCLFRDAIAAMCELKVRIPDDLMVVAHANKGSGVFAPFPVSFIEIDPDEYARKMGDLLVSMMKKEPVDTAVVEVPFRFFSNERVPRDISQKSVTQGKYSPNPVPSVNILKNGSSAESVGKKQHKEMACLCSLLPPAPSRRTALG
ncbi:MAG: GntR family transcriptional regulator [Victivallales bacterium]|nr:GntR family transcriptional regulator [Victivallales bacterium]